MRRKVLIIGIMAIILTLTVIGYTVAAQNVNLEVNGQPVESDVPPYIQDGRVMVPIRVVSEAMGADVNWDQATYTAQISFNVADSADVEASSDLRLDAIDNKLDGIIASLNCKAGNGSRKTKTFTNNTGRNVNDLHIEFRQACYVDDSGPFQDFTGGGTSVINLSNPENDIPDGTDVKVSVSSDSTTGINIEKWWWTKDGSRVGPIYFQ
ncbi:copper amine oxidase N-terminal domain-containing protein [Phosphitispora sp. TUW77]|uniref:copper amine oxidase N-terminal domain-containing protein n=1 Tax=Phosphitispora sp. TUW77 TaxID=3152361 RepID=UPI003AB18626